MIRIYSASGQLVYDETCTAGAFNPAKIDMSDFAPGTYRVVVTIKGKTTERTIVKL
ncbi:MAG: T9SS type A sorting domain-containing protein [Bacteroidales bacterium]|nr:T9SS type A sorting domain-containing protein [Bacteroidales bacterium]